MELILTGDMMDANDALRYGLVSHVYDPKDTVNKALEMGKKIASFSKPIVAMAKECVNKAYDLPLTQGLAYEKKVFWATFATKDQKEGMKAFAEKREPKFTDS